MTTPTTRRGKPRGKGACPTFLCVRYREARRGGAAGYRQAGYATLRAVAGLQPDEDDDEAWGSKLDRLADLVAGRDRAGILGWFDREVPRLMALVPARRRPNLVEGMLRGAAAAFDRGDDPFLM